MNSAAAQGYEFTSQLYFDDALMDRVHAQAPYSSRGQRSQRNTGDGIFQGEGKLLLALTQSNQDYAGTFDIGLRTA